MRDCKNVVRTVKKGVGIVRCQFPQEDKDCDIKCQYYHVCTRGEYYNTYVRNPKKESNKDGNKKNS